MKSFDEVFIDSTKHCTKIKTDQYHEKGKYIIIDQGQSEIAGYTDLENGLFSDVPAIIFGDHTRVIKYIDEPFFIGADGVKVLKSKLENANYKYLFYALKNAKIPNTGYNRHFKWLKETKINYPDNEKQAEIVSFLDKLQSIITHRKQQLAKLDELVKARFVEMFGNGNYPNVCIGEVLIQNTTVEKIIDTKTEKYVTVGIRGTGARERIIKDGKYPVPFSGYRVKSGQFIYSRIDARNGAFALLSDDLNNAVVSKDFPVFDINQNKIIPFMLLFSVLQDSFVKQIQNSSFGATNRQRIKEEVFSKYKIALPPLDLQNQFAAFVRQVDKSKFI